MTIEMILFLVVFAVTTALIMLVLSRIKEDRTKNIALKVFAWSCFITHISVMWQTSLTNAGSGFVDRSILWPIYFCNVIMYLLLILATMKKDTKVFKIIATFTAYAGIIGALVTFFDYKYLFYDDGGVYSFERLKSTISHALLLMGSLYLFVGGWVKVRFKNVLPYTLGVLFCGFVGGLLNWFFIARGIDPDINAMWLRHTALEGTPFTGLVMGLISIGLVALFSLTYEFILFTKNKKKGIRELYFLQETKDYLINFKTKLTNRRFLIQSISILLFTIFTLTMVIILSTTYAF